MVKKCSNCRLNYDSNGKAWSCSEHPDKPTLVGCTNYNEWQPIPKEDLEEVIKRLKNKAYVKMFQDMSEWEQEVYREVGKENCLFRNGRGEWEQPAPDPNFAKCAPFVIKAGFSNSLHKKKKKEKLVPKEKPKAERSCPTCRFSMNHNSTGNPCQKSCVFYELWQPIVPKEKPEKQKTVKCGDCVNGRVYSKAKGYISCAHRNMVNMSDKPRVCDKFEPKEPEKPKEPKASAIEEARMRAYMQDSVPFSIYGSMARCDMPKEGPKKPQIKKEKTMFKRVKKIIRMAGTLWLMYGVFIALRFIHPWIYKFWHSLPLNWESQKMTEWHGWTCLPWLFTVAAIIVICVAFYSLHKFTDFFFGEK